MLSLEALHSSYEMTAIKLKQAREKLDSHIQCNSHFKMEDSVLIKDHTAGPFDPVNVGDYHFVSIKGNHLETMPSSGGETKQVPI